MKVVSVNVGLPKTVQWRDQPVSTGIFKSPVEGPVALRKHNLDGDQQADLSVHGGPTKAGVRISHPTLYVLARGAARCRFRVGPFRRELHRRRHGRGLDPHRRRVQRRDGPGSGDRAAHAVLQTQRSLRPGRHAEAVPPESAERLLLLAWWKRERFRRAMPSSCSRSIPTG